MPAKTKKDDKCIVALGDAEPEDVFCKMFQEADKKIRPELRKRRKRGQNAKVQEQKP